MLKGSLDDFALEDIFWLVDRAHKTGRLNVTRPSGSGSFYFRDGRLYWAETDLLRESVTRQLIRAGLVTETQLKDAESRRLTGESLGQGLTTLGMVTPEELNRALLDRAGDVAFELVRRDLGEFDWDPAGTTHPELAFSASVEDLLRVVSERLRELDVIRRDIPSEDVVLTISGGAPEDASAITVSAEQWKMLALANGRNTVADIGRATELNDLSILRLLHGMVARGLLEVLPRDPSGSPDGEPPAQNRTIVIDGSAGAEVQPGDVSVRGAPTSTF